MEAIGRLVQGVGWLAWIGFGIWGFIIDLAIVNQVAGFWGLVIAFAIAPVTFVAAPFYALVAWGTWFPLLVCYGGGFLATALVGIGSVMAGDA